MVANKLLIVIASLLCGCLFLVAIHGVCNYAGGALVLGELVNRIPGLPASREPFEPLSWGAYAIIEVFLLLPALLLSRWLYLFWREPGICATAKGAVASVIWGSLFFIPFGILFVFKDNKLVLEEWLLYGWVTGWMFWGVNVAFTISMILHLWKMDGSRGPKTMTDVG